MIKSKKQIFKISELNPAHYNPRKISDNELNGLTNSLNEFGYLQDIVVNIRDGKNVIVSGHQRLKVLDSDPSEEIECTVVDLDELREKALNVTMNNNAISGSYDAEMLEGILQELHNDDDFKNFDELNFCDLVQEFGFNDVEIKEDNSKPASSVKENECPKCKYKW